MHQDIDAPRLGNPRLAYGFRVTPEPAIGLDDHYKRPCLRRHFPSLSSSFSLYFHPSVCTPPIRSSCSHWASVNPLWGIFFESQSPSNMALPCLVPVISPLCGFGLSSVSSPSDGCCRSFCARIRKRLVAHPLSILLHSHTLPSPWKVSSLSRKMLAHPVLAAAAAEGRSSHLSLSKPQRRRSRNSFSPAPDSPIVFTVHCLIPGFGERMHRAYAIVSALTLEYCILLLRLNTLAQLPSSSWLYALSLRRGHGHSPTWRINAALLAPTLTP